MPTNTSLGHYSGYQEEIEGQNELGSCPKCGGDAALISFFVHGTANRVHSVVRCRRCKYRHSNEYKRVTRAIEHRNSLYR